ncbi:MAG: hypothetical protein HYY58_02785 [Candidatus Omnitrophica bacterium]|nr:hypothetical protein [Candidatus Omnitrophota bacterium]
MFERWHPNIYVFASLSAVVSGLAIAGLVYFRARRHPAVRPFSLMVGLASLWCLFPTLTSLPLPEHTLILLARLTYLPGAFAAPAFLHLAFAICGDERHMLRRRSLQISYGLAFMFSILIFAPGFISGLIRYAPHFAVIGGSLYDLFAVFYLVVCIFAITVTIRNLRRVSPKKKNQLRYFLIAEAVLGLSPFLHFGGFYVRREPVPHDFLVPLFALIVTYAILKHRLMDVQVVIRRSVAYSILIGCITATYLVMVLIMEKWFQGFLGYRSLFATVVVAFLIAIFFNPLRNRIQEFVDRRLFKATPVELAAQRDQLLTEVRKGEQQKAVATLAAGLAHEIKNPLASIKTFTDYLNTRYDDPAFRAKFQKIVGGEVERINLIVQRLLEFAKPVPPKLMPVQVAKLVDETLEFLSGEFLQRHIEVHRRYEAHPQVLADPQQLKQVFLNLFLNSLDAMTPPPACSPEASYMYQHDTVRRRRTEAGGGGERAWSPRDPHSPLRE